MRLNFRNLAFIFALLFGLSIIGTSAMARNILPIQLLGEIQQSNEEAKMAWADTYLFGGATGTGSPPEFTESMMIIYANGHSGAGLTAGCASHYDPKCSCTPEGGVPPLSTYNYTAGGC